MNPRVYRVMMAGQKVVIRLWKFDESQPGVELSA